MNVDEKLKMIEKLKDEGISSEVAEIANKMVEISFNKKVTSDHLKNKGLFTKELHEEFEKMISSVFSEAKKVFEAWHEFELRDTMNGLGGCKRKSLKQIINENNP